jgi:hypothetical protein
MSGTDLNTPTVGGLLAYCDWLKEKGYQGANAVEAWKTAIKKVFETVESQEFESISLDGLDLDDYSRRFKTIAGAEYKAETIDVYARRIRNAIEAQQHYRKNGKPPSFRKPTRRPKHGQKSAAKATAAKAASATSEPAKRRGGGRKPGPLPVPAAKRPDGRAEAASAARQGRRGSAQCVLADASARATAPGSGAHRRRGGKGA